MSHFDVYGRTRNGKAMVMIRNHNQCRALYESSDPDKAEQVLRRIERELERSTNKFEVLLSYYKEAKSLNIYQTTFN